MNNQNSSNLRPGKGLGLTLRIANRVSEAWDFVTEFFAIVREIIRPTPIRVESEQERQNQRAYDEFRREQIYRSLRYEDTDAK